MSNLVPMPNNGGQIQQAAMSGSLKIQTMDDLSRLAKMMSMSGFFEDCKDAAQAGVKIMAGLELGFPAFSSLTGIHIIKGRPAIGANLMAAAIKRTGRYNYRVLELSNTVCRIAFYEGGEQVGISEFTAEDARAAGTQNMAKFAKNMLFARAMSNGVKWYCPDIFLGTPVYTPEELGATVDGEGNVIDVPSVPAQPAPVEVVDEQAQTINSNQVKRLHTIKTNHGWSNDAAKELIAEFGFNSSKDITTDLYDEIIQRLELGPEPVIEAEVDYDA